MIVWAVKQKTDIVNSSLLNRIVTTAFKIFRIEIKLKTEILCSHLTTGSHRNKKSLETLAADKRLIKPLFHNQFLLWQMI